MKKSRRFKTVLDEGAIRNFQFDKDPEFDLVLVKEFRKNYSIWKRILDRF